MRRALFDGFHGHRMFHISFKSLILFAMQNYKDIEEKEQASSLFQLARMAQMLGFSNKAIQELSLKCSSLDETIVVKDQAILATRNRRIPARKRRRHPNFSDYVFEQQHFDIEYLTSSTCHVYT